MKDIVLIIILLLFFIGFIIIYNRDRLFYFHPKKIIYKSFDDFLNRYNAKKYKALIDDVDLIDIPARKKTKKVIVFFHGNSGNITYKENILSFISDSFKTRVISVDYLKVKRVSVNNIVKICCNVINKLIE